MFIVYENTSIKIVIGRSKKVELNFFQSYRQQRDYINQLTYFKFQLLDVRRLGLAEHAFQPIWKLILFTAKFTRRFDPVTVQCEDGGTHGIFDYLES